MFSKGLTVEDETEERIARLERRQYADRCAITTLTGVLALAVQDDSVREAFVSWSAKLPKEDIDQSKGEFEEARELFVTLAALASSVRR